MDRKRFRCTITALAAVPMMICAAFLAWLYFTGNDENGGSIKPEGPPNDYSLAGVSPGMKAGAVQKRLGSPLSVASQAEPSMQNSDYTTYWETWRYKGLGIVFVANELKIRPKPQDPGIVAEISATSKAHRGPRGLKVGDPLAKALRLFETTGPDADGVYWHEAGDGFYVSFKADGGRVSELTVGYTFD